MFPSIQKKENIVELNNFEIRDYQMEVANALEIEGFRRIFMCWSRRMGKDILCWNLAIWQALLRPCLIMYALPTYQQARRCIWDALTSEGPHGEPPKKFLDMIPHNLIANINHSQMKITLVNGSKICLIGGDSYDTSLVGTNCYGLILSEAALMDLDNVYAYARPILAANGGFIIVNSTPRGKNSFYHLYNYAKTDPEWFVSFHNVEDVDYIPKHILEKEKASMSPGLYAQEYLCSFERGQQGIIFGDVLDKLKLDQRFIRCNYDPSALAHIVFDIGVNDPTAILWFQVYGDGQRIVIIDCFEDNHLGMDYYIRKIQEKPYRLGTIFAPHDIMVREWANGARPRLHMMQDMGLDPIVLEQQDKEDSIENALATFPRIWIDSGNCQRLVDALENYRREWDDKNQIFKRDTIRNWAAHYCFTGDTEVLTLTGMRRIIDIKDNDIVKTLAGWQKCTKSFLVKKNASLVEITFNDNTRVRCTPDHMFLTVNGWISAENLLKDTKIQSSWINGISIKHKDVNLGKNGKENNDIVNIVKKNIHHLLEMVSIINDFVIQTARQPLAVNDVKRLSYKEDVYCISVPNIGHFSLSNGAIVKNCDALRYMCQAIEILKPAPDAEIMMEARSRALYGSKRENSYSFMRPLSRLR